MSAFIVDKLHIDAIVTGAIAHNMFYGPLYGMSQHELGKTLLRENVRSVNYRYNERNRVGDYRHAPTRAPTPIEMAGLLRGLDYNSSERDDYYKSLAYQCIGYMALELTKLIAGHAFDNAPWVIGEAKDDGSWRLAA